MFDVPSEVRELAMNPFGQLPTMAGVEIIERPLVKVMAHKLPIAQVVMPNAGLDRGEVAAAVADTRELIRSRGDEQVVWWNGHELPWLGESLEQQGLRNEDCPGFESVENVMVLTSPPSGEAHADIVITDVDNLEDYTIAARIQGEAFQLPEEARAQQEAEIDHHWADYSTPGNPFRQLLARIEDEPVGMAGMALWQAGVNLFGGAVLPTARGRGVYTALTHARWRVAVERGTPALTIQAGRMSRPIAEALGFRLVASVPMYVDNLSTRS